MTIFQRILALIFPKELPFVLHEAYPEIVFWEVGQNVILKATYDDSDRVEIFDAVVEDFDKNGEIVVKIKKKLAGGNGSRVLSKDATVLMFNKRISPTTINVSGSCSGDWNIGKYNIRQIYNENIRGKGSYMELLKAIKDVIGMQDWEDPKKLT